MDVSRYRFPDSYAIGELRLEYEGRDPSERIELLESFYTANQRPPCELAMLAVQDASARVRHWLARNASDLDYREAIGQANDSGEAIYRYPDRDLRGLLAQDRDELVRAGLLENPALFGSFLPWGAEVIQRVGPVGRLALMRNPHVSHIFVGRVFDPDDTTLGLDLEEREELIRAYFSNTGAHEHAREVAKHDYYPHAGYLFERLKKWPNPPRDTLELLLFAAFADDPLLDAGKAHFYQECESSVARYHLLQSENTGDRALALALSDEDESCREEAYSQIRRFHSNKFTEALAGADRAALRGLSENKHLGGDDLKKLHERLLELEGDEELSGTCRKVEELIEERTERERWYEFRHGNRYWYLDGLFGNQEELPKPSSLEESIELIGRRVTVIGGHLAQLAKERKERREATDKLWEGFGRVLIWGTSLFLGFLLLRWLWRLLFS